MNRIIQVSFALAIAGAAVLSAGCNRRDEPTSAGTPGATTTDTTPSTTMTPPGATTTPDTSAMPSAPASAASQ